MKSRKMKPELPSTTSTQYKEDSEQSPPDPLPTLFLDNDQGTKILPDILTRAGLSTKRLQDSFDRATPDHEWIPEVAKNGWVIVTSDKGIETDPQNREAVIESNAKIVMLDENNSRAVTWASAIIVSRESIRDAFKTCAEACIVSLRNTGSLTHTRRILVKPGAAKTETNLNLRAAPISS